jgi:hypothetical protein
MLTPLAINHLHLPDAPIVARSPSTRADAALRRLSSFLDALAVAAWGMKEVGCFISV